MTAPIHIDALPFCSFLFSLRVSRARIFKTISLTNDVNFNGFFIILLRLLQNAEQSTSANAKKTLKQITPPPQSGDNNQR